MRVALVEDHYGEVIASRQPTWEMLCRTLSQVKSGSKEGPAWIPGDIPEGPRKSDQVRAISYLVIDVEVHKQTQPPTVDEMIKRLSKLQLRCMLHTTYNHDPAAPRYRLIFCLSNSIMPKDLKSAIAALARRIDISGCYDTSCTDPARLFYLPRCKPGRENLFQAKVIDGLLLDVGSLLGDESKSNTGKINCPLNTKLLYFPTPETPENTARLHAALRYVDADCDYQMWRDIVWAVISTAWDSAEQIARDWSMTAPLRFKEHAFRKVVDSFDIAKGITLGTLFYHAKASGWSEEAPSQTPENVKRFNLLTFEQCQRLPPMRWRVKGLLPRTGVAAIYGQPGSGKSFAVLDMLLHLSLGRPWFGYSVRRCPVVYVALEGSSGLTSRLGAWYQRHGERPEDNFRIIINPFSLLSADIEALTAEINDQGLGGGVIALDTLAQSAPGTDENSSADMGTVISRVQRLQALTGSLVILVHHTGKEIARGLRGHSSLLAALDAAIEVTKSDAGYEWKVKKSKDGVDGVGGCFSLKVVGVGVDEDGDPVTSCVVEPDSTRTLTSGRSEPRGKNQKAALRVIGQIAGNLGLADKDQVLKQLTAALSGTSARHKPERAKKSIDDLIERGFVKEADGRYVLI